MKMETREEHLSLLPEDFVDMVSHEMRTPLTSIRASLGLLAAGVHGETTLDQQQALKVALSNIERMGRLLDDLLDMTKIRVGRLELRRDRVDWSSLAQEVSQTFEPLAQQRGIHIRTDILDPKIESYVDRDKVVQILSNLIHNAVKFTPEGTITISVQEREDWIDCSISDTGPGIPQDQISRLFSKFTQLGGKSHTGERGSGLGLSLARQLVELHGGSIRAENLVPHGARFIFSIPRLDSRTLFEQEADRLVRLAGRHEKPLTLAQFEFTNWSALEASLGAKDSAAMMNHFETLIRASLRGESDFVLQSRGALWLAVFSVNKVEGFKILDRIRQTFEAELPPQTSPLLTDIRSRLASFPEDGKSGSELCRQLQVLPV